MNDALANLQALGLDGPTLAAPEALPGREPPGKGWSRQRWLVFVALIFATHIAFIFALGEKKEIVPRVVRNVPTLKLADNSDELLMLNDPTLFLLPHQQDFASAVWLKMPEVNPPSFRWMEPPCWLLPSDKNLGATFQQYMRTNYFASYPLNFKPPPKLSEPSFPVESALAQNSTMQVEGGLAQRQLLNEINLPSLSDNDVITPSVVQVLVGASGNVVSAVLLPSENSLEADGHDDAADQRALELARAVRFAPSPRLTLGRLIFNWHTFPPATTNSVTASP